jgi:hypothetical protein
VLTDWERRADLSAGAFAKRDDEKERMEHYANTGEMSSDVLCA